MSTLKQETIDTYDQSAEALAEYFVGIGARTQDIQLGIDFLGNKENIHAVELGCGDGRDAAEIVQRVVKYNGMDISEGMLRVARRRLPDIDFMQADVANYVFPKDIDIVYAFASLLHSPKEEVQDVLSRAHQALRPGGIFYISLKHKSEYGSGVKTDQYGKRLFYFYNPNIITELAGDGYENVHQAYQTLNGTDWFTTALKKR